MNTRLLTILISGLILLSESVAQANPAQGSLLKHVGVRQFSTEQGLSQNSINAIMQDNAGFIWVGTESGLNQLTGSDINIFNGFNNELQGASISFSMEDSLGRLWVATYEQLYRFDFINNIKQTYPLPELRQTSSGNNYVIELFEESNDLIWMVTRDGVLSLSPTTQDVKAFSSTQLIWQDSASIRSVSQDDNSLWLGTTNGLYRFSKESKSIQKIQLPTSLSTANISDITTIDGVGVLLASATEMGLYRFDGAFEPLMLGEEVTAIAANKNFAYVASKDRLYQFFPKSGNFHHLFSLSQTLPQYSSFSIEMLFIDSAGLVWLGTESQGIMAWDPIGLHFTGISQLTSKPNIQLSNSTVWDVAKDFDRGYWVATNDGLNYIDVQTGLVNVYLPKTHGLPEDNTRVFFDILSLDNSIWLASDDGLYQFNQQTRTFKKFRPTVYSSKQQFFIYNLTLSPQGDIWMASDFGALKFNRISEKFDIVEKLTTPSPNEWVTFVDYIEDYLWVGYPDALVRYEPATNKLERVFEFAHLNKNFDLSLTDVVPFDDKIWVSFNSAGIYILKKHENSYQVESQLHEKNGFPASIIHTLIPQDNYIWASTHSGLIKIDSESMRYSVYDFYSGLPTNEFNEGAGTQLSDGRLAFGATNGLIIFDPKTLPEPRSAYALNVTKVFTQDSVLNAKPFGSAPQFFHLAPDDKIINFEIGVMDYLSPNSWRYEYKLSGDKITPLKPVIGNTISFYEIDDGDYELTVLAKYSKASITKTLTVPFTIKRDAQIIHYLFAIAALSALVALIVYFVQLRNEVKELALQKRRLARSSKRLEQAVYGQFQGTWEWKRIGVNTEDSIIRVLTANHQSEKFQYKEYRKKVHSIDRLANRLSWMKFFTGRKEEVEVFHRIKRSNHWEYFVIRGLITQRDRLGTPNRAVGTWTNISSISKQLVSLNICEKAIQATRDIIMIIDSQLKIVFVNKAYDMLTGYSHKKLVGMSITDIISYRFDKESAQVLLSHLSKGEAWQGITTLPVKHAPSFSVDVRIDPFLNEEGDVYFSVLMTDTSSIENSTEKSANNAYFDSMTGLPNKVLALDRLSHAIAHAKSHNTSVVLVKVDIDKFDFYQHTFGKSKARELLINISQRVSQCVSRGDTFARIENDKFYIIFEDQEKIENVSFKIEEIRDMIRLPQMLGESPARITACVGVACYPLDAQNTSKLIECSDTALNQAKSIGEDQISYYHRELNKKAIDRLAMRSSLKSAIKSNQFYLVYQPKFEISNSRFIGFEVFVRWRTPEGNIVYPSQFLKIAEDTGLIESLTEWLINQSLRTLKQWIEDGFNTVFAINLIPQYCQEIGSAQYLSDKLAEYRLSIKNLHIEINEKQFSESLGQSTDFIGELKDKGFNVTLDDFGTGNTPLNYLKTINIDAIKLERNFIRSIGHDTKNDALVSGIINLANSLGIVASAKSIEYSEQLEFLAKQGCKVGQGYYFSDPLTESGARQFLVDQMSKAN